MGKCCCFLSCLRHLLCCFHRLSSLDTPSTRRNGPYSYFTSVVRIHELTNWGRRSPRPSMGCIYARSENQCDRAWAAWTAGGLRSTEVPSNCTADWHCRPLPWVLGPLLAARGLEVLVPLIPGMGNNFNASGPIPSRLECTFQGCNGPVDDVQGMAIETQDYIDYATRINEIVRVAPAPRAVLGLSVGGTLSAFAGQALDAAGDALFARQLHINPEIKSSEADAAKSAVLEVMNKGPHSRRLWLGWGPGCRHERSLGRAGICTFRVENLVAAGHFGVATSDGLKAPRNTSIAVLYDNGDPVISTPAVRILTAKYREQVPDTQSCVFNFTMHSMLSKWDDLGQSKWWINEVSCDIVNYL